MKKTLAALIGLAACYASVALAINVYNAYLVNETALAYSKNYVLNLNTTPNASGIARLTAQAVYSSNTLPTDTFNDGRVSTASITVASNSGLVLSSATDKITIAADSVVLSTTSSNTLTVVSTNGLTGAFVTVNGTKIPNTAWRVDVTSDTAADVATQINTYVYQVIAAANGGSTISLRARKVGTDGNAYTLASSTPSAISVGSASFTGGKNNAFQNSYLTVNGINYYRGYSWNVPGDVEDSTHTAASVANLFNHIPGMQATVAGSVVFTTATVGGTASNSFTIVSSTPNAMTVLTPTFTGGVDNAVITINGTRLTQGNQWSRGASVTLTAVSIAAAMNSSLSGIVTSTNVAGVVNSTSTSVGTIANYTLTSSTPSQISVSHPTYVGGTNAAFSVGGTNLFIPAHGYGTGVALLLTGATPPGPLAAGTTYYAITVDANDIGLATSLANAKLGTFITFTSSTTTGPHTTTLTPLAMTGTPGLQWQVSNDCVNYTNYTTTSLGQVVSSVTIASPYTAGVTTWDLGPVNYQCIQMAVTGPTAGALALQVRVNGSNP